MLFEKILDGIQESGRPKDGDLVLFQIENDVWTAAQWPRLAQKLYADEYGDIERQALEYAADKSERGIFISVWREGDANKDEYFKVL